MAYTIITQRETKITSVNEAEIKNGLDTLAESKDVTVSITLDTSRPKAGNITQLQLAINKLETLFSNNCCQANCCQTCQACQTCQTYSCQSSTCQKCQTCQRCQSTGCQRECGNHCDCNCDC